MNSMNALAWLFPILYMLHDFEEIILVGAWKKRYAAILAEPRKGKAPYADFFSPDSFSVGVAIFFVLFSVVTLASCLLDSYVVWFGLFFAIVFHFFLHVAISLRFGRFVPGLATSVLFAPLGAWLLFKAAATTGYGLPTLAASAACGLVAVLAMLAAIHKGMGAFARALGKYSSPS